MSVPTRAPAAPAPPLPPPARKPPVMGYDFGGGTFDLDDPGNSALLRFVLSQALYGKAGRACSHCQKPLKLRSIVIREPATTQGVSGSLPATGPPAAA